MTERISLVVELEHDGRIVRSSTMIHRSDLDQLHVSNGDWFQMHLTDLRSECQELMNKEQHAPNDAS